MSDQVYETKNKKFAVHKLTKSYGVYNRSGKRILDVPRFTLTEHLDINKDRAFIMARRSADAISKEFEF